MGRQDRQLQQRREALERALDGGPGLLSAEVFFQDHADLVQGLAEVLEHRGLEEAFRALACHLEEDRELWLRRLEHLESAPTLTARRAELDRDYHEVLAAHFRRWGAAGTQGERIAELEATLALAAFRGAERLWVQGNGRPLLPILAQEALALLWPALYAHARRHR